MSKIIVDIKQDLIDVYYETDNNSIKYEIATLKDSVCIINESTNKIVIELIVEIIYRLGNAIKDKYKLI